MRGKLQFRLELRVKRQAHGRVSAVFAQLSVDCNCSDGYLLFGARRAIMKYRNVGKENLGCRKDPLEKKYASTA